MGCQRSWSPAACIVAEVLRPVAIVSDKVSVVDVGYVSLVIGPRRHAPSGPCTAWGHMRGDMALITWDMSCALDGTVNQHGPENREPGVARSDAITWI
eukprot:CAMPEP_0172816156 /NCGR_PEP_ID=MMETSP1075-20121228/12256_1 /TAXON_ID=2916 /ORGANISM="Ceratium fusus, Strain PA161109" /LENGTH=97 /DNA_ID=CAMNT_0013656101 /DNA_START=83 /DNA_END=376 /DNA_ORIENTATION=-